MTAATIQPTFKMVEKVVRDRRKAYAQMVEIQAQRDALSARIRRNFDARFNGNWQQRKANEEQFLELMSRRDHLDCVVYHKAAIKFIKAGELLDALRISGIQIEPNSDIY